MTGNTIENYNDMISNIGILLENASESERICLESAMDSLKTANEVIIDEKKNASKALYESGSISESDYEEYLEYVNDEKYKLDSECDYFEEATTAASLSVSAPEKKAYISKKYNEVKDIPSKSLLSTSNKKFILKRLKNGTKLKASNVDIKSLKTTRMSDDESRNTFKYKSKNPTSVAVYSLNGTPAICCVITKTGNKADVEVITKDSKVQGNFYKAVVATMAGVMTDETKSVLSDMKNQWDAISTGSEKVVKEFVETAIEETGDTNVVTEALDQAVSDGVLTEESTKEMRDLIDAYVIQYESSEVSLF